MTVLGDPSGDPNDGPALWSPDGESIAVITRRGNLKQNSIDYSLLLFRRDELFRSPSPHVLLKMTSSSSRPAIENLRWTDNQSLVFLGEKQRETHRIYRFDVKTSKLTDLFHHSTSIVAFDATKDMSTIAFLARPTLTDFFDHKAQDYGLLISNQELTDLLAGHGSDKESGMLYPLELFITSNEGPAHKILLPPVRPEPGGEIFLSPDGEHVIIKVRPETSPDSWKNYQEPIPSAVRADNVTEYLLVDAHSGSVKPLLDAPASNWRPSIAWTADSKSVVVVGTYLPLNVTDEHEREEHRSNTYVAEVSVEKEQITVIDKGSFDLIRADPDTNSLLLRPSDSGKESRSEVGYRRTENGWKKISPQLLERSSAIKIAVKESMNSPPRLIARNSQDGSERPLLDPNPQFANLSFGNVQEISWTSRNGHAAHGGLYLPPDYVPGHRYPLVIQTHGWNSKLFWIDGVSTAGYAAQALAGKEIIVAQTADGNSEDADSVREGPSVAAMLEGLIDYLDRRGMIDRERIGLLGWSRTGYHVRFALVFSKYPFAAAVIADGLDGSYLQYLSWLNLGQGYVDIYERLNGGAPIGPGLENWIKQATGFNLDRVHTPVRLLAFRPYSLLNNWEWFAVLRHLGRPVELVWLPNAEHAPVKPSERMIAQQGDVDWFCFWLKDEEDPDPAKQAQYARWRELREQQRASSYTHGNGPNIRPAFSFPARDQREPVP